MALCNFNKDVFSRLQLQKSGHLWFMCILLTFILLLLLYVFYTKNTIISSCIIQCNIQDTYLIFSSFHNMCTSKRQVFFKKKPFENGFAHCLGSNGKSKYYYHYFPPQLCIFSKYTKTNIAIFHFR